MARSITRVLIVDDDEDIRLLVRMMLSFAGFSVVAESANGEAAVADASSLQPDVVILDVQMPRMSGEVAAPDIRSVSPGSKIIAFSAHLDAAPSWADAWLSKGSVGSLPTLIEDLMKSVGS